jgi:hypothetical protein
MMTNKLPQRDPEGAWVRKATAARRVGVDAQCACGERRPEALIPQTDPITCHECQRIKKGMSITDNHHPAGEANDPTTIPAPVNDHRAELNTAQADWPKETLENEDGSPLLALAGCMRGYVDTDAYLQNKLLLPRVPMLEALDQFLVERLGPEWWIDSELEKFAPKSKPASHHEPK